MTRIIPIQIDNEFVKGSGVVIGAANSHDDVMLDITFGSMWDNLAKHITWLDARGENPTLVYLTTDHLVPGKTNEYLIAIPTEAKAYEGEVAMSIKGAKTETIEGEEVETRATLSVKCTFKVLESVFDASAEESAQPTPTIADQLQAQIDDIIEDISSAETNALKSEGYAVGKQNGTDVGSTSPYYHNNALYYADEAEAAESKIVNMTVSASSLPEGSNPTVTKTEDTTINLHFGIPKGKNGIFECTYNETTGTEIAAALAAGKLPILDLGGNKAYRIPYKCKYNGYVFERVYILHGTSGGVFISTYTCNLTTAVWSNSDNLIPYKDDLDEHTGNTNIHVRSIDKSEWSAKYDKPALGIPSSDMTSAVQTSLGKADSAVQNLSDLNITATASELNVLDGITASTNELNILSGVTANAGEINVLDGITVTTEEINFLDGVVYPIQTALNNKVDKDGNRGLSEHDYSTAEKNKVATAYNNTHTHSNKSLLDGLTSADVGASKENVSNKVTTITSASTDTQYPSAKAVETELEKDRVAIDNRIKKFYTTNRNNSDTAYTNTVSDSDDGAMRNLKIYGKGFQQSYTGKNLLENILTTPQTSNGVTITPNADRTFTVLGTATAITNFNLGNYEFESGNTYRLVGFQGSGIRDKYTLYLNGQGYPNDLGSGVTFTATSSSTNTINLVIPSGTSVNMLLKPMLCTDTTATYADYEPYVGGIPSPSPSYPQTIHSVVNPIMTARNPDSTLSHTATLSKTLNAIPVSSGGNITIDGQQYISDYVDVERKKFVRPNNKIASYNGETITEPWLSSKDVYSAGATPTTGATVIYKLATPTEESLTDAEVADFIAMRSYYPQTNVSVTSDDLDGQSTFLYPCSMENFVEYVKGELGDERTTIYNMQDISDRAYINAQYAEILALLALE